MLKNYLKTAIRSLIRNRFYSIVNIAGLSFGLVCFLLIGLYIFDELTFDGQHTKKDRIFRVIEHKTVNGESSIIAAAGYKLAHESKNSIPGVENTACVRRTGRTNITNPENPSNFFQETVTIADEHFLDIFDFPLIAGDRKTALTEPNSIVITKDLALRLFNRTDVLGRILKFVSPVPFKITGVMEDHPQNSSFKFGSIISEASLKGEEFYRNLMATDWFSENFSVYVLLKPKANPQVISLQMSKLVLANYTPPAGTRFHYQLQALKDIHLRSEGIVDGARNSNVDPMTKGSMLYISIFSFIALFILLIAGINYMNLTTARASGRLKEIGVRKTIGAYRSNLVKQFLIESVLVSAISFVLAVVAVNLLLPAFNSFANKQLTLGVFTDYRIWIYAVGFTFLTGLVSGSYPALLLSRFKVISLLKGIRQQNSSELSLRKGLVIFQFTISIVMIIGTIVLFLQVHYLNNTNLGFNKDLLVVIDVNTTKARTNFEAVKAEISKIPSVKSVAVSSRVPGEWKSIRMVKIRPTIGAADFRESYMIGADPDFLNTYEIKLLKGRNFESPADSTNIIVNETAARMLGIETLAGQVMEIPEMSRNGDGIYIPLNPSRVPFKPQVVGIVTDFHFQSLREKIEPLIICYSNNPVQVIDYYTAKISATGIDATLAKLKNAMLKNDKNDPFEYHFLNDQLALFYLEDGRRQTILFWVSIATIFISCLGLFGLATYSAEKRVKEIGVRKVMGATVFNLTSLLSKDFLKLVFIANGIAFPIAWWASSRWLQEYAYHIEMEWWVFVIAGLFACSFALVTVSYQAIKAAMTNPVASLRIE